MQNRYPPPRASVAPLGPASVNVRSIVDAAFVYIRNEPGGGREVLAVVEDDQVMLGCGGTDQQIHGRQRTVGSLAHQPVLSGLNIARESGNSASP